MAWVSVIGPSMEQVDYRLQEGAGCGGHLTGEHDIGDGPADADGQIAYRLADERGLMWVGQGLHEFGLASETSLPADQHDMARAVMSGLDPITGEELVPAKHVSDPRAKLAAAPLEEALQIVADAHGVTVERLLAARPAMAKRAAQMARGIARQGEAHLVPIKDLEQLARAAGIDLAQVYGARELAYARKWRDAKVRIGNRGYDLTLDVSKSVSVLYGLAEREFAAELEEVFAAAVTETVTAVERWAAYGQRGHQGDGQLAEQVDSTGLLGWVMWHRTARPVGEAAPDPHLHAHVTIANMVRGRHDGKWSAIAAGGRDIHRHAHAADALLKARLRRELTQRYGIAWKRDSHTGAWEIAAIPARVRALFSKRDGQVKALLTQLGTPYGEASRQARKVASAESRQAKHAHQEEVDLRADWRGQCAAAGVEPVALVHACRDGQAVLPERPSPQQIAEWIWRPQHGLTAHRKVVSRADVLAAVIDALPDGVADLAEAEALTDEVLQHAPAVRLANSGASHLTNSARYTSSDILQAERGIIASVRQRYGTGVALVDNDAVRLAIDAFQVTNVELSAEQRAALERVLTAGHGVEAIVGVAGAGKTTIMAAARSAFESRGLVVRGAATAAVAAANLSAESGIPARTIATWLQRINDPGRRGLTGVDVLVVDEAAMVDDRELATLLSEAERVGTKIVLIGDPMQLRAVGVGGGFRAVHRQIAGLTLGENRRQRDPIERRALQLWREDKRHEALRAWGEGDRVHAGRGAADTMARLIADWATAREPYRTADPEAVHDELAGVLVLAGTNQAADRLNLAARAVRRQLGEITGPERTYRIAGGRSITLAVGDHVRVRRNDYRARRGEADVDVLNGYRGQVTAIDERGRVKVEWRHHGPDGPTLTNQWISPRYIAEGGVSYGTAMTVAAAQGLTAEHALIYGMGLDPHTLYSAMTRDRQLARLYLPRELLETDADRVRHGPVRGEADELQRALAAYAASLEGDHADHFLTPQPEPIAHQRDAAAAGHEAQRDTPHRGQATRDVERDAGTSGTGPKAPQPPGEHRPPAAGEPSRAAARDAERQAATSVRRVTALLALSRSRHGVGLLSDGDLAARGHELGQQVAAAAAKVQAAERDKQRVAREGGGRAERELLAKREQLAAQVRQIEEATEAAEQLRHNRQIVDETRQQLDELGQRELALISELNALRPWQRARRRELEAEQRDARHHRAQIRNRLWPIRERTPELEQAAQRTADQAPPAITWPLVRRRHADLSRDFDAAQRGARSRDVTMADQRAQAARAAQTRLRQELAAVNDETARRADLPPDRRDIEQAARAEHAERQRQADAEPDRGRPASGRNRQRSRSAAHQAPPQRERDNNDRGRDMGP